jgi:hypothetical protein
MNLHVADDPEQLHLTVEKKSRPPEKEMILIVSETSLDFLSPHPYSSSSAVP